MPSIPDDQDPILISRAVLESIKIEMSDDDYLYGQSNHLLPKPILDVFKLLGKNNSSQKKLPQPPFKFFLKPNPCTDGPFLKYKDGILKTQNLASQN
ncbi:hypothetical protein TNIN_67381 [Trichonephila inaurata madagascariensis]|uniref:Uncharacterized protein n=1 Tax=Trichonephila inaurata madagascariensis TaxID=2747483 RepID=A0A8X7CUA9_9ARAC|nr:hypothetical protein TNIN_67381 [Trichonephila inaurata madagascariensis]